MSYLQDYSCRLFTDFETRHKNLTFKSVLHGNIQLSQMSFNNFIMSYSNFIYCVLKRFLDDIKHANLGE
jgi:hypothetical protein